MGQSRNVTNPTLDRLPAALCECDSLVYGRNVAYPVFHGRPAGFQKPDTLFHSRNVPNPVLHRRPAIFYELYASFKRETVFRFVRPPILYVVPPFRSIVLYFGKELNRFAVLNLLFEFVPLVRYISESFLNSAHHRTPANRFSSSEVFNSIGNESKTERNTNTCQTQYETDSEFAERTSH